MKSRRRPKVGSAKRGHSTEEVTEESEERGEYVGNVLRMPIDLAAEHMSVALKTIYTDNSCEGLSRYPSGGLLLSTGEQDLFGNFAIGLVGDEWTDAAGRLSQVGAMSCLLNPGDSDETVESQIAPFGYQHAGSIPSMTVDLEKVPEVSVPSGYEFQRLTNDSYGEAWARVLSEGYPVAIHAARSMSPLHALLDDRHDARVQFFQVVTGESVAGVSALVLAEGVAGVYCVTTLAEHRRKGLGAVLTALPLARARQLGYSTGVLQASQAGIGIYAGLGFEVTGAVQLYVREAQTE